MGGTGGAAAAPGVSGVVVDAAAAQWCLAAERSSLTAGASGGRTLADSGGEGARLGERPLPLLAGQWLGPLASSRRLLRCWPPRRCSSAQVLEARDRADVVGALPSLPLPGCLPQGIAGRVGFGLGAWRGIVLGCRRGLRNKHHSSCQALREVEGLPTPTGRGGAGVMDGVRPSGPAVQEWVLKFRRTFDRPGGGQHLGGCLTWGEPVAPRPYPLAEAGRRVRRFWSQPLG